MEKMNGRSALRLSNDPQHPGRSNELERDFRVKAMTIASQHPTPRTETRWACVGEDPELFHPQDLVELATAQAVCGRCPVRETCLDLGVSRGEWGVWGGQLLDAGKPMAEPKPERGPMRKAAAAVA